ncbi:hypothetical protein Drorol1_Dr00011706 [Drosera rotundifolia]
MSFVTSNHSRWILSKSSAEMKSGPKTTSRSLLSSRSPFRLPPLALLLLLLLSRHPPPPLTSAATALPSPSPTRSPASLSATATSTSVLPKMVDFLSLLCLVF